MGVLGFSGSGIFCFPDSSSSNTNCPGTKFDAQELLIVIEIEPAVASELRAQGVTLFPTNLPTGETWIISDGLMPPDEQLIVAPCPAGGGQPPVGRDNIVRPGPAPRSVIPLLSRM